MKKFFAGLIVIIFLIIGTGFYIGDYFVNYALKRGNADDPLAPPAATLNIADPNLKAPPKPDYFNETWTLKSEDGLELHATYFVPEHRSHLWAILVHGYGRDQTFAYDYAEEYLKRGWNVLTPDLRASGTSEGTFLTMGTLESRDIVLWTKKICEYDPQAKIILHGVSMGAATVLMASALEPENVFAVVEDCGYTNAYEMFTAQLKKIFGLPEFPIMNFVDVVSKFETGVKVSDAAPIESVTKTKVPTLFIHGDADGLVPYEMMQKLFAASNAPVKEQWTVEGAGHADAKSSNPQKYFERVFEFLDECMTRL